MQQPDNHRLDKNLRTKVSGYEKQPSDKLWEKIQPQVGPPARTRWYRLLLPVAAALLLLLTGNLLPRLFPADAPAARPETAAAAAPGHAPAELKTEITASTAAEEAYREPGSPGFVAPLLVAPAAPSPEPRVTAPAAGVAHIKSYQTQQQTAAEMPAAPSVALHLIASVAMPADSARSAPVTAPEKPVGALSDNVAIPIGLQSLVVLAHHTEKLTTEAEGSPEKRSLLLAHLRAEKAELERLQQLNDSLLRKFEAPNPEYAAEPADSAVSAPLRHRWSVAVDVAPELNFLRLQSAETDTLSALRRNHESGRAGLNASVRLEYQLSRRLRVGTGIGFSTYGAELRLTNRQTVVEVQYDTITTLSTNSYSQSHTYYTLREVQTPVLDPVYNASGQVIGYTTKYVTEQDTVWHATIIEGTDTVRKQVVTPLLREHQEVTYKKLKPEYRFVTVPVMLHYRITPIGKWWAEAGMGGQLQFFRGGTQLVTEDGRTFQTERVKPSEGPFRQVNLSLMGNLSVSYGLSSRLSVNVTPAVRWQVQSVYKKETGLKQNPFATGLQVGLRYTL